MEALALSSRLEKKLLVKGQEYLCFNGTSYLGLETVPGYLQLVQENLQKWGIQHGLSRTNNVKLAVFDTFEEFFSKQAGAESAAVFSSGYLAGIAASNYLFPKANQCWAAPDTHPAVLPLGVQSNPSLSHVQWIQTCMESASLLPPQKILILGNAVDPLKVEIHSYEWVLTIAQKHEVTLLIDDSHAFGVLGHGLFGTYSQWKQKGVQLFVSGSLGKGLATPGGVVLGPMPCIQDIKSQAIFAGASPPSPAMLQSLMEAQDLLQQQQVRLKELTAFFYQKCEKLPQLKGVANFPVFVYAPDHWTQQLFESGFITASFSYPSSNSPKVNRIVLSASHTLEEVKLVCQILAQLSVSP